MVLNDSVSVVYGTFDVVVGGSEGVQHLPTPPLDQKPLKFILNNWINKLLYLGPFQVTWIGWKDLHV